MTRPGRDSYPVGLVLACGLVELTSWGSLYYAVPVLHPRIADAAGWSPTVLSLTFSASLVTAALLGPLAGTLVDRHGPRALVTGGVLLGGAGLLVVAAAPSPPVLAAGMVVVGVAQTATLYPPILAALTIWLGARRAGALTVVTLLGGVSSTVYAPSLVALAPHASWRTSLLLVALTYVAVTAPVAWLGLRRAWVTPAAPPGAGAGVRTPLDAIVGSRRFRALQAAMLVAGVGLYASTLNLIPLAREQGHAYGFAALVFGLVGAGQVAGRLLYLPLARRGSPGARTTAQVVATAVVVAGLGLGASTPATLVVAAILAGAVRGAHTLALADGVADRWGTVGFGALSGRFNRPVALGIAVAPALGATTASLTGSHVAAVLLLAAAVALVVPLARRT